MISSRTLDSIISEIDNVIETQVLTEPIFILNVYVDFDKQMYDVANRLRRKDVFIVNGFYADNPAKHFDNLIQFDPMNDIHDSVNWAHTASHYDIFSRGFDYVLVPKLLNVEKICKHNFFTFDFLRVAKNLSSIGTYVYEVRL